MEEPVNPERPAGPSRPPNATMLQENQRRGKVIFLTGAPDHDRTEWDETRLLDGLVPRLQRFMGLQGPGDGAGSVLASHPLAKWRALTLDSEENSETGKYGDKLFLSFQDDRERSDFLEHTLVNVPSSQIGPVAEDGAETSLAGDSFASTVISTELSFDTTDFSSSGGTSFVQTVRYAGSFHDLRNIPSPRHLLSIQPQTMTVDLVVGIISLETRTVQLRSRAATMDLVELLVGDETSAPFKITFWLRSTQSKSVKQSAGDPAREVLQSLRSGDVVLITNVALDVYKGVAYGQSLPRRVGANSMTTITLLKLPVDGLATATTAKLDRVCEWTRNFVGRPLSSKRRAETSTVGVIEKRSRRVRGEDDLPDDTQID